MKAEKSQPPSNTNNGSSQSSSQGSRPSGSQTSGNQSSKQKQTDWTKFLGPVEDLESYVKADWWRQIFNANYLRTDGDVVEDPNITRNEIDLFLDALAPNKESTILDLCCGQGRHTLELARRGYQNLFGLDRSHYLINRAKSIGKKEGLKVTFKEGDARKLPFATDKFDYIMIPGNSFGYFESSHDDTKVLEEVRRILKPNGKLLVDITDGDYVRKHFQARSWEWIDKKYFVCRERALSKDQQRLISREVITHVSKGVIADQFYAERLYSESAIRELLAAVGFVNIDLHTQIQTDSQRNQDLGMMAQRILVTAEIRKAWAPQRTARKDARSVVVIMGDPQRNDIVKPDAGFDEDDFQTINELKRGLSELHQYKISYLNNHTTLIGDLQKIKGKVDFVFNLCDEGYNNEALKELHVPALLEMLDIPYTGGNPQCLAYCYDKSLVRGVAQEMDIPVPFAFFIKPEDIHFIDLTIEFPVIVKPNFGDSSFGITRNSVCHNVMELENALLQVREKVGYDKPVLVEQFLTGKDISVGIIGNSPESYQVLPVIEEDYSVLPADLPKICGYEAKWDPTSPYWNLRSIPANLSEETERYLVASCLKLAERLGCRDYVRLDWRLDSEGTPRLLEVNPNPGWCWDGHLAKMAKLAGYSYPQMLGLILKATEDRLALSEKARNPLVVPKIDPIPAPVNGHKVRALA
ncbi:MAG TPA: methyltransferase domain-containing protein [Caldilineaceae bacterium]|nr:methyltransferase domain-containing protein [Caldilineaceae bacterium]